MRRAAWLFVPIAIFGVSPAAAQEVRTYSCTDSNGITMRYMIGPGILRDYLDGKWAENYCEQGGRCRYEGSQFVMDGGTVIFHYDPKTGAYVYAAIDGSYEEHGTCTAE
jgi:hypothetical protein